MRVTREQAATHRDKIVEVASELFRERGFDGAGVSEIMKAAGLTHGGFYGHFKSKDELAAEACARALSRSRWESWMDAPLERRFEAIVRGYLTPRHRDDPSHGCLFAAVGSDVVRQPRSVRRTFTEGLRAKIDLLLSLVPGRTTAVRRERALATMSGLVGALILSRAVDDPRLSDEILAAAARVFSKSAYVSVSGA